MSSGSSQLCTGPAVLYFATIDYRSFKIELLYVCIDFMCVFLELFAPARSFVTICFVTLLIANLPILSVTSKV